MKVKLNWEQLDEIVVRVLKEDLADLKGALKDLKEGHLRGYFSFNSKEEKKELKKAIKVLKAVLARYE